MAGGLLPSFALMQMFSWMLVLHCLSFVYAAVHKTEHYFDATGIGCIAFMAIVTMLKSGTMFPRQLIITATVVVWAARLAWFLLGRIGRVGKDSRFDKHRDNLVNMFLIFAMSALWGFLALMPVFAVNGVRYDAPLGVWDRLGWGLFAFGFVFEWLADHQKSVYNRGGAAKVRFIQTGLWRYSRHPNYFGEIVMWFAIYFMSLPIVSGWGHLVIIGPLSVVVFLCFISGIPLLEHKADKRWGDLPGYRAYKRRTSILVPMPPCGSTGAAQGDKGGL